MAGFQWKQFYTLLKEKIEASAACTVGQYGTPAAEAFPYVDLALSENTGGNYDLEGGEGSQNPRITISVYSDSTSPEACETISRTVKELMLSYGFQCRNEPRRMDSSIPDTVRWEGQYQRIFADGDELVQLS